MRSTAREQANECVIHVTHVIILCYIGLKKITALEKEKSRNISLSKTN